MARNLRSRLERKQLLLDVLLRKLTAVSIAVALLLGATAIATYAAPTSITVTAPPTEVVVGGPGGGVKSFDVPVFIKGSEDSVVTAEFVDYLYGANNKKENLPAGSTPYSLSKVLRIEPFNGNFQGSEKSKNIVIKILVTSSKIKDMYYGGLVIQAVPKGKPLKKKQMSAATTSSGVVSAVNVFPYGFAGGKNKDKIRAAEITSTNFIVRGRTSVIDYILPDLPGIVNSGPIEAKLNYKNSGKLPIYTSVDWKFLVGGKQIASQQSDRALLRPGLFSTRSAITQAKVLGTESVANILPSFGLVEIVSTLSSDIAGTTFKSQIDKSTIFVIQWKEPVFFTALVLFVIWYAFRKRPSSDGSKKRKDPSLAWLAIVALRKWVGKKLKKQRS